MTSSTDTADTSLDAMLAAALQRAWGSEVAIDSLHRLSGGASRETWAFTAHLVGDRGDAGEIGDPDVRLIFQRERPGASDRSAALGMAGEARLLRVAAAAGVPVADVVAASMDAAQTNGPDADKGPAWVIARQVDGESIARRILRDDEFAAARTQLVRQAAGALAAVHRIRPADVPGLIEVDPIERYRNALDELGEPHPALELGLRWLTANRPPPAGHGIVHGDFRLGNWLVAPDGLRAVLDWELAHVGDPAEDLGWVCVRAWRFGGAGEAAGLGGTDELLAAYREAGGAAIDLATLRWWEALGTLAWGVMCIMQAARHRLGLTRSVELATIGRRVAENEHDLLALVPGPSVSPSPSVGSSHPNEPHDVPTASELVEAVSEFLASDVAPNVDGAMRFHTRVATNALAIVQRQLDLGAAQADAHATRLAALGFADDRALASAIRGGELDDRWDEVKTAVWGAVIDKLAVAHPGYTTQPRPPAP